jgi:hypothetical protein
MVCAELTIRLGNHIGHTQWNSYVTWVMWNLASIRSEMVLASLLGAQFARNLPIGTKSFWRHPMVLIGDEAQIEAHFGPFGDSANLEIR